MLVTLVTWDRLPVGVLGCYGATWNSTPAFDRLAAESLVLDQCFAEPAGWQEAPRPDWERTRSALEHFRSDRNRPAVRGDVIAATGGLDRGMLPTEMTLHVVEACTRPEGGDANARGLQCASRLLADVVNRGSTGFLWVALPGLPAAPPAAASVSQPPLAAGEAMRRLDADWAQFWSEWQTHCGQRDDALLVACGLGGDLLWPHPLVAQGLPPLIDELLQVPVWIHDRQLDRQGTRLGRLLTTGDLFDALRSRLAAADQSAPVQPQPAAALQLDRRERAEVWTVWPGYALSRRTVTERVILSVAAPHDPTTPSYDEPARVWLFSKPDDVWDRLDLAAQRPAEAETHREELLAEYQRYHAGTDHAADLPPNRRGPQ